MVKFAFDTSKNTLPTASTLMRPAVVDNAGSLTSLPPLFGVLAART